MFLPEAGCLPQPEAAFPPPGGLPGSSLFLFVLPVGYFLEASLHVYHLLSSSLCQSLRSEWVSVVQVWVQFGLDYSLVLEVVKLGDHIIYHLNWNTFKRERSRDSTVVGSGTRSPFIIHKGAAALQGRFVGGRSFSGLV